MVSPIAAHKPSFKTTPPTSYHCYTTQAGGGGDFSFVSFVAAVVYTTFCTTFLKTLINTGLQPNFTVFGTQRPEVRILSPRPTGHTMRPLMFYCFETFMGIHDEHQTSAFAFTPHRLHIHQPRVRLRKHSQPTNNSFKSCHPQSADTAPLRTIQKRARGIPKINRMNLARFQWLLQLILYL